MKGQSNYDNSTGFHMGIYLDMDGYDATGYGVNTIEKDGESGDPFLALGINSIDWSYAQGQVEIGLLESHRIRVNSSGIYGWDGDSWVNLITPNKKRYLHVFPTLPSGSVYGVYGVTLDSVNEQARWLFRIPTDTDDTKDILFEFPYHSTTTDASTSMRFYFGTYPCNLTQGGETFDVENYLTPTLNRQNGKWGLATYTLDASDYSAGDLMHIVWFLEDSGNITFPGLTCYYYVT